MNTQSRPEFSVTTNQIFHNFFRQQFKRFSDECQLPSRYLNWMLCSKCPPAAATHENQVSFEMTGLPYQWTPVVNHSISIARQSSDRQCWTVLAWWISDSIPAVCIDPTHYNPTDFELAIRWLFAFFNETRALFNELFTLKNAPLSSNSYNFLSVTKYRNEICRICGLNPPM